jgi:hypothetical protein
MMQLTYFRAAALGERMNMLQVAVHGTCTPEDIYSDVDDYVPGHARCSTW